MSSTTGNNHFSFTLRILIGLAAAGYTAFLFAQCEGRDLWQTPLLLPALLARAGADVTLLDASEEGLDQARRRFGRLGLPASFVCADMLGPLQPWRERHDVALSSGVIEHFVGDQRTRCVRAHREVFGRAPLGEPEPPVEVAQERSVCSWGVRHDGASWTDHAHASARSPALR